MNLKKIIALFLLAALLLAGFPVSAAERKLTLNRAVQINETQIVLEFSEPIALNLNAKYGPFFALRLVDAGQPTTITNVNSVHFGQYLQWPGTVEYIDSKHDRLIWTMNGPVVGVGTISGVINHEGELSQYAHLPATFTLEEVPVSTEEMFVDNKICNVTTRDGQVYLTPTLPTGWEKCNVLIEKDFEYEVDLSHTESTFEYMSYQGQELVMNGATMEIEKPDTEQKEPVQEVQKEIQTIQVLNNDPMFIAVILASGTLLLLLLIVIGLVVRKKRKAVSK